MTKKFLKSKLFFVDSDTLTAIYFDTDTGIVDKCTHEYDWQYVTSSSDTVIENVVTDTSVSGYSLSFNSADKARAYLAFSYNDTYTSGHLKTIEGIFFVDTSTSTSGTSVLFSYAGYSYWLFNGGNGKSNFVYYLSCSYSESSASLNYSFMGTSATVAIPLSTFDEPFHVAYSADFVNRKAYIFLNGSLLETINDKIISSGKTGSENYYFRSVYILRIIAPGCMCTAVLPDGESAINMARKSVYGVNTADTLNGRCLEFRVSLSTKYTEDFTPYKSTVFAPNLPVKGNLCVRALTPYAQNTKILMHFDDPDNPLKDECGNSWAVSGTPSITDTNAKFGKCCYFNKSTWFQSNNAFPLFGQDFTVSFWVYPLANTYTSIGSIVTLATAKRSLGRTFKRIQFEQLISNTLGMHTDQLGCGTWSLPSNSGSAINKLQHYAVTYVHETGTWRLFLDGILQSSKENVQLSRTNLYVIVGVHSGNPPFFNGYLDELLIIDGTALWTEDFIPPDKPYFLTKTLYAPLVMEKSPTADSTTVSLLHFDDPNNPYKDEYGNIWKKITSSVAGEVIINTSAGKFGGGCLQIVPKGKQVIPYTLNPIFFGGRDFTFDFWTSGDSVFYTSDNNDGKSAIHFAIDTRTLYIEEKVSYPSLIGKSNVWRHYALVYNWTAKQLKLYENGILKGTYSYTCTYKRRNFFFLTYAATNTAYPPRVDEFRLREARLEQLTLERERQQKIQDEAISEALRALCRDRIFQGYRYYNKHGGITAQDLETMTKLYNAYHALGGNGTMTAVYEKILSLPIKEE